MSIVTVPFTFIGQDFRKYNSSYDKIVTENDENKVSNDYYWKSNEYHQQNRFGMDLDLTSIIDKPDGFLQGKLESCDDIDYYKFSTSWLNTMSRKEKYNLDTTVTLDNVPQGCDFDLFLYDEKGNQVGIATDNGNGGKSVDIPNWSMNNKEYTIKVMAKDGSFVDNSYYHISFQTKESNGDNGAYRQMQESKIYEKALREKLYKGGDTTEELKALQSIRDKYDEVYDGQMMNLHKTQAEKNLGSCVNITDNDVANILSKLSNGEKLSEEENSVIQIYATAYEYDGAKANAILSTTLSNEIDKELTKSGIEKPFEVSIDISGNAHIEGIQDENEINEIKKIIQPYAEKLFDIYITVNASKEKLSEEDQQYIKSKRSVDKFLNQATGGKIGYEDLIVENGVIKGLPDKLGNVLNNPGNNIYYSDLHKDICFMNTYERMQNKKLIGFEGKYSYTDKKIQVENNVSK